jgi:predicted phosphodiesterase
MMPADKECSVCLKTLPATKEHFHPDPGGQLGFRSECRTCRREKDHLRHKNKDVPASQGTGVKDRESLETAALNRILGKQPEIKSPAKVVLKASEPYSVVIFSDAHVPEHDPDVWRVSLDFLKDTQPDELIINGDFLELLSCSQHGGVVENQQLVDDFRAGRQAIQQIRDVIPNSKITYLEGNHETRLERYLAAEAPTLFGTLSIPEGLHLDTFKVEWVPERQQPVRRGNLLVVHGHQLNGLPKHLACKLVEVYGESNHTVIMGHAHRAQVHTQAGLDGNKRGITLGAMRTKDPTWLHGAKSAWSHQICICYVDSERGTVDAYPITIEDGRFVWAGKSYS